MRNQHVEEAVDLLLGLVDALSAGSSLGDPPPRRIKAIYDDHIEAQKGSVRLACAFLAAYSVVDPTWDFRSVPTGVRGKYGDKRLATELTRRHVTLHNSITAFGENLGWKGAVRQFDLSTDTRFSPFLAGLQGLTDAERMLLVQHIAWRLHASRETPQALPPLPSTYLSYARCLLLCQRLLAIHSEGHIQQFLVAAFLEIHRRRFGHVVITHHPHASDKFDGTYGDVEEYWDDELVAAYEVTVRDDWKNRLTDFSAKAAEASLARYVIFAADVRKDPQLHPAARLVDFCEHLPCDFAVVDISDFFSVFSSELNRDELADAFNRAYELLADPRLSGRTDFMKKYREVADEWLES